MFHIWCFISGCDAVTADAARVTLTVTVMLVDIVAVSLNPIKLDYSAAYLAS